ncbi:MAG: hypothetical protein FJ206_17415 [Gemmatimonadetes bacterium]|nr:hypothetical protein [Gemmatimonadota bacterium]
MPSSLAAEGQPPLEQLTPVEARAAFAPFADFAGPPEPVTASEVSWVSCCPIFQAASETSLFDTTTWR